MTNKNKGPDSNPSTAVGKGPASPAGDLSLEPALRASHEASRLMMGIVELLPDGDVLHLYDNAATSAFFESTPEATAGRTARAIGVPDQVLALWRARYDQAVADGAPVSFDYLHQGSNGRKRSLAVTVTRLHPRGPHGGPTCCYTAEDVSEQRRAESVLRQAIESTSDAVFVLSSDWRLRMMNGNARVLIAGGRDLIGHVLWEAFPEAVGGAFWHAYQRCMSERVPTEAEEHYGPLARTFAARAFPLDDEGITVFFQDVTEARRAERDVKELTATMDLAAVFVRDLDGTIRHWSAGCQRLYGWSADEAVGRNAHALLQTVFPVPTEEINQALERNGEWTGDLRHTTRDGRVLIGATRKALRRATPSSPAAVAEAITDVTAARLAETRLRESEATLSAVLDALPVGVVIADSQGRLLRDNAANRAIWGVPPEVTSWEQYGAFEAYWPDKGQRIAAGEWALSRALLTGEVVRGELVESQPFDGGPRRFFLNNAAPVRDATGRIVGGVAAELDVTDQRKAEAALARSDAEARLAAERLQLALSAAAIVGTWDWEMQADRLTVDERFAEAFGIDPELGRTGLSLEQLIAALQPEDRVGLKAAIEGAIAGGGVYRHEYRVRGRDGRYRWVEGNGRVDYLADGTPARFPGVLLDIERRRALEAERDRATQLLRAFVDAVPGVVYAKDHDGRMLVANRGVSELVGKPPEAILGTTDLEFLDHKEQAAAVMANDRRVMDSGKAEAVEEEVSFPDGRHAVWLSTKAPFRDDSGNVVGLIGSSVDITDRKTAETVLQQRTQELAEAQLRLEIAMSAARMGVWDWSSDTGHSRWSAEMFQILGVPAMGDGQALGDTFMSRVHPEDRPALDAALARALAQGTEYETEVRVTRPDGQIRWLLGRGRVLLGASGRPERMVGVNLDITERKVAEQALVESDRHRNEFLAMLGHELRNPLAPIANAVHLLEMSGGHVERRSAAVQIIRRQTAHMARLVDDLLEVSRVTQGRIELRKEDILVASAVFSAVETVRPLVRERSQMLEIDVAQDVDMVADQARLTQVVANLLNNASKYTQTGGHITVTARAAPGDEGWVEIVVADNGPGIDEELLPRIFELFSQASSTLDRSRGGLGLGLALVKRLVELHGGSVRAQSAGIGHGASFTVRLPRAERRRVPRGRAASLPGRVLAPTSFLIVDDNVDAVDTLAMLLEADGHRVERAYDGEEALAVARRFSPRVVLLDIGLPRLDGWEVARRLRADPATAGTVLIAFSGYGQSSDRERSRAAGFDVHLLKPVELDMVYGAAAREH